jgi:hypothetical protein
MVLIIEVRVRVCLGAGAATTFGDRRFLGGSRGAASATGGNDGEGAEAEGELAEEGSGGQ